MTDHDNDVEAAQWEQKTGIKEGLKLGGKGHVPAPFPGHPHELKLPYQLSNLRTIIRIAELLFLRWPDD